MATTLFNALDSSRSVDVKEPRRARYERLMRVSILHDFYNRSGYRCPDFSIAPTPTTATLLKSLGLLFQDDGDGFSVLYDAELKNKTTGLPYLISYLQSGSATDGLWTRLTFQVSLTSPEFYNYTDTGRNSIDIDRAHQTFYLCNQQAHGEGLTVSLTPCPYVSDGMSLPLSGEQYSLAVNPDTTRLVEVTDLSGTPVLCNPVNVPMQMPANQIDCASVAAFLNLILHPGHPGQSPWKRPLPMPSDDELKAVPMYSRESLFMNFFLLPYGWYQVWTIPKSGDESTLKATLVFAKSDSPCVLIDLLLTQPPGVQRGIYPVAELAGPNPGIDTITYQMRFRMRATVWIYYIVPARGETYTDLSIVVVDPEAGSKRAPAPFKPAVQVILDSGRLAYRIESTETLVLEEQSRYNFRLTGNLLASGSTVTLVNRLPVASRRQVIPGDSTFGIRRDGADAARNEAVQTYSYMYVNL